MTEFFSEEIQMQNRRSSKGNQLKFERNHVWYKADYLGYEGLVEYVVSKLLRYSSLQGLEYVDYELEQITYNGQVFNACKSQDFYRWMAADYIGTSSDTGIWKGTEPGCICD